MAFYSHGKTQKLVCFKYLASDVGAKLRGNVYPYVSREELFSKGAVICIMRNKRL